MSRLHGGTYTPQAPPSPGLPAISGIAIEGQDLTVSAGAWGGVPIPTLTYQWRRCDAAGASCVDIAGATAAAYSVAAADVGSTIRCVVTGTNSHGQSSVTSAATAVVASPGSGARTFPGAADTGADPASITTVIDKAGGFHNLGSAANPTLVDTEILGGLYWAGTGVLTLDNVILRPDGGKIWAGLAVAGGGRVVAHDFTLQGYNITGGQRVKGLSLGVSGDVEIWNADVSSVCQNALSGRAVYIHDSWFHHTGAALSATCHGCGFILQGGGSDGEKVLRHNTVDNFPGLDFQGGDTGAIFAQGNVVHVPQIIIDDNFLHGAYSPIEIDQNAHGVAPALITNNVLVWPLLAPNEGAAYKFYNPFVAGYHQGYGNTQGDLAGNDLEIAVPLP